MWIKLKRFTVDSINYHVWELGIEFEIALTAGSELNFDKSSLHFKVKQIYIQNLLSIWL